jgi:hypothetical protein
MPEAAKVEMAQRIANTEKAAEAQLELKELAEGSFLRTPPRLSESNR